MLRVVTDAGRPLPRHVAAAERAAFGSGFHDEEWEEHQPFRWMAWEGELAFAARDEARHLELWVFSPFHDLSQRLRVRIGGAESVLPLTHGWARLSLAVPARAERALLAANKELPARHRPGDPRVLTVRLRGPRLHADTERRRAVVQL